MPLALVAPIAAAGAPPHHASAVYTVLFVLFGTFGSAIPWVRDGETGWLERLALSGPSPGALIAGRSAAAAALDFAQLLPALALLLLAAGMGARGALATLGALLVSLLLANLLGCWVAAVARSVAEAALLAAVSALLLLHGAGTFRVPAPGTAGAVVARVIPFRLLHDALLAAGAAAPEPPAATWGAALAVTCAAAVATLLAAPRLLAALTRPTG